MKKLYIIDDDEMLAMMLSDHLMARGDYHISTFTTGEEYLGHLPSEPHVLILDFNLNSRDPGAADGLTILREIRRLNQDIPVIMYSSQQQYDEAADAIKGEGVIEYVIKDQGAFERIAAIIAGLVNTD